MLELMPLSKVDDGSARLKKAVDKELFISRCRNRLKGKKNLKRYFPERFSFLYQYLWNQMPPHIYENIIGKLNKSNQEFQSKVVSSMVPDEVLYNPDSYEPVQFMTAMMFLDISGFTDLSELYSNPENGGASKLSQVLNTYLGGVVQEILGHGGDIVKFSGDAILVLFKATSFVSLPDAVHRAIDTAIIIQIGYGRYETDVGVTLRIKIAISAGEVHFCLIGSDSFSHYIVVGQPVWKVKLAERTAEAGDIIVTYYAWSYIHENEYIWEPCADRTHLRIKGFTSYWRSTKRLNFAEIMADQDSAESLSLDDTIKIDSEMLAIRPRLMHVTTRFVCASLQKFLIKPVLNAVANNEPLELLTEMRQIVSVFLNIVFKPREMIELITEINSIFISICKIVEGYDGIVNKISLFDKDVMFLIIFGLRGLKHEMDSQIALHCAAEIQGTYSHHPSIISASIGVTTGIAYCGVVGHTVRREYSAIGVDVNKAARLMMAYPHKVTCDKSTFMMSKLDPAHFTLQDAIQLKGLHNVGPIYEFREFVEERELLKPMVYNYPLVDRDQFVELFQEMIDDAVALSQGGQSGQGVASDFPAGQWVQNCLLIRGEAQMGKTRLVNEFFYIALRNKLISSLCFSLHLKDSKVPFSAASLCVSRPLGFTDAITTITRQNRIKQYLRDHKVEEYLSLLNELVGTKFAETDSTRNLSYEETRLKRKELFEHLCQKTFQNLWVLIIDDAEFIDDDSFDLLEIMWRMPQIITVLAIGYQKRMSNHRVRTFDIPHVCQVKLPPIETLLHKAIACQFLNVNAIPLDLERLLHTMSSGNPGWINTFLLCLRQSGVLRVNRMGYCEAQQEGYVFCESSFLHRECGKVCSSSSLRQSLSDWQLFESSYAEAESIVSSDGKREELPALFNKIVDVACLAGQIDVKSFYESENLEAFHLMLYDSLSAFEQLVCKCAAFLGRKFLRASLMHTMATESEWDVAIATKKLFDLQILSCAIGDFSEEFRLAQTNVDSEKMCRGECACKALDIDRTCKDLPKYAVCGYSKFNSSTFHRTVYNLVTEEQKMQYHTNVLVFIEAETKKCKACGARPFRNLMTSEETFEVQSGCRSTLDSETYESLSSANRSRLSLHSSRYSYVLLRCLRQRRSVTRQVPVLSYGAYSFVACNCDMILYRVFSEIALHSKGAGLLEKCVEARIEWARICIKISNIPKAISILYETERLMVQIDTPRNIALVTYLKGRMYTLLGKAKYSLDQYERAGEIYYRAARTMGMRFPHNRAKIRAKTVWLLAKVKRQLHRASDERDLETRRGLFYCLIVSQIATCFNEMHKLLTKLCDWDGAALAAIWGLKHALQHRKRNATLVNAFANFFHTGTESRVGQRVVGKDDVDNSRNLFIHAAAYHTGLSESVAWMQERSLEIVAENRSHVDADYLDAVVRFYSAIFLCQTLKSKKLLSIEIGKVMLHISDKLQHQPSEWQIIPILCELLLSHCRISETVHTLACLQRLTAHHQYRAGHIWYHALCLDILLDTSCCIESYRRCESFYFQNRDCFVAQQDHHLASARLFANLWLWCVRYGAWVAADNWLALLQEYFSLTAHDSTINVHTAIRILEGMVLTLIYHIEARNTVQIGRVRSNIEELLASIEQALRISRNHVAKYELMRIYYRQVVAPRKAVTVRRQLTDAAKRASQRNDHLCYEHIQHTAKFWHRELPVALEAFWLDHAAGSDRNYNDHRQSFAASGRSSSGEQLYDYASCILNHERIYPYSMPLPRARFR